MSSKVYSQDNNNGSATGGEPTSLGKSSSGQEKHGEGEKGTPKAIIKNVDMSEEMQQMSVDIALEALSKFTVEKDIAAHVKKTMDTKFGPTWHAVVGQKYGSYVTHETNHFIYFYLDSIAFLLWRA